MLDVISMALMFIGTVFMFVAAVGILRLPDLFCGMSAVTKAATLGIGCVLSATALHFDELWTTGRAMAIIAFVFVTAPVAAHRIARAAYLTGVPLWEKTEHDELRGRYDVNTRVLSGLAAPLAPSSPPDLLPPSTPPPSPPPDQP